MSTVLIDNSKIIFDNRLMRVNIIVEEGKFKAFTKGRVKSFDRRIDARGRIVLPGLVDGHAHLYDPAYAYREDFRSGTAAAAAGGVTSVVEMVLSTPVDSVNRVAAKIEAGKKESLIDFSLHAGMMNKENLPNIPGIIEQGVRSFKTFTCKPYFADDHTLMGLLHETSTHNAILNVHAEDEETANRNYERLMAEGRKDPSAHSQWKPNVAEALAIRRILEFAKELQARVHISHMSTQEGTLLVKASKRRGIQVTTETCPHYLTFTKQAMRTQGPFVKMNPCLKGARDVAALWKGLRDGSVDMVTSEHAPGERAEKEVGWTDIWKAWGGIPSIETMLPVMLSEGVNKYRLSLSNLQRVCCENPAIVFGLRSRKGAIRKGADADLVMIDLKLKRKVRAEDLHYKVGWTPYEGRILKGWSVLTMSRGEVIYEDEQVVGKPGDAEFLPMNL